MTMAQFPAAVAPADPESGFPLGVSFWASVTQRVIQATLPSLPLRGEMTPWSVNQRGEGLGDPVAAMPESQRRLCNLMRWE